MILRGLVKSALFELYRLGLKAGLVILPNHYYVENPDVNALSARRGEWAHPSAMTGIDSLVDAEVACLRKICRTFVGEVAGNQVYLDATARGLGPGFGYIEAQVLHCFLRATSPQRVIEVGSGVSTACMLHAVGLNEQDCAITCVEPFPKVWLSRDERITLRKQVVQSVPVNFFESLEAGDFLFIDSSHAVKTGSDVNFLILEVLPRLRPGVYVHFHDISLPYDYSPDTLRSFIHPQETALLHAFLIGNRRAKAMFSLSRLHHERPDDLKHILPEYSPMEMADGLSNADAGGHFPSSLYLRVD